MRHRTISVGVLGLLLAAGSASAQWSADFDGYADGTVLYNIDGWTGWDDDPASAGTVSSAQSNSGPHSIAVGNGYSDAVRQFAGYTSGQWTLSCQVWVPDDLDGITYFIVNNEYAHFGPYDWAVVLEIDPGLGLAHESLRDPDGFDGVPIVYNQWVELSTTFDLDANTAEISYGGTVIASGVWNAYAGGAVELQAIDLYAPHAATVYFDDLVLSPPGDPCVDGYANCNGDNDVNTQDFLCYLGKWSAGDTAADCNGDGSVNTQDFLCYLGLWSACQ